MALCEIISADDQPNQGDPIHRKVELNFPLHRGQARAFRSRKRFVGVIAGTQSGKTSFGPIWLWEEIRKRGPGDYLVVTPTYPLMRTKALPEFLRLFKRLLQAGEYRVQQKVFTFNANGEMMTFGAIQDEPTQIFFGHATDPDSLESATAKAAWLDEAGQRKFRLGSWEAIQRRLSIHEGRALITTTPYDLGWLKQLLWDPWKAANGNHPDIDIIRFDSTENPAFPKREFERARQTLPRWKFDLFYRGIFTRPAGLIYSSFDPLRHKCPRFAIPPEWPRFLGLDFGGVNTAGIFFAEERNGLTPTGRLIAYREYRGGERSAAEHCYHLMAGDGKNPDEPRIPLCAGGSKSESQWRREFAAGGTVIVGGRTLRAPGLPVHGPHTKAERQNVEIGIDRVFAAFALGKLLIFDDLWAFLDELNSYSRELDEMGNATRKIDNKDSYHLMDAMRYIISYLDLGKPKPVTTGSHVGNRGRKL